MSNNILKHATTMQYVSERCVPWAEGPLDAWRGGGHSSPVRRGLSANVAPTTTQTAPDCLANTCPIATPLGSVGVTLGIASEIRPISPLAFSSVSPSETK
jgi:hypothetical protein